MMTKMEKLFLFFQKKAVIYTQLLLFFEKKLKLKKIFLFLPLWACNSTIKILELLEHPRDKKVSEAFKLSFLQQISICLFSTKMCYLKKKDIFFEKDKNGGTVENRQTRYILKKGKLFFNNFSILFGLK